MSRRRCVIAYRSNGHANGLLMSKLSWGSVRRKMANQCAHRSSDVNIRFFGIALACALHGCASAPIVSVGEGEFEIGESGRDNLHRQSNVDLGHYQRAQTFCRQRAEDFQPVMRRPPDGKYHFRCNAPPPPPPPPVVSTAAELQTARIKWRECLEAAEPTIDDMLSDANTVASTLAVSCADEFSALLAAEGKGRPSFNYPYDMQRALRHDVARGVVLQMRARHRNPNAAPPTVSVPALSSQ